MSRMEFMRKLAELLEDLPAEERSEALQFYNGYFYDAGPEAEAAILRELVSPEAVSEVIHREVLGVNWREGRQAAQGEPECMAEQAAKEHQTSEGCQAAQGDFEGADSAWEQTNQGQADSYRAPDYREFRQQQTDSEVSQPPKKQRSPWLIVLMMALGLLFLPVIFGLGGGAAGLLIGALVLLLVVITVPLALGVAAMAVGVVGIVTAATAVTIAPAAALLGGGVSLMSIGFGLLVLWLFGAIVFKLIPWLCRSVKNLWQRLFRRRAGEGQVS